MSEQPEQDRAADLLERLLTDPGVRDAFRRDPAGTCRELGLHELADELSGSGKALYTLELRESRSSVAGVLMAAAAEAVGVAELAHELQSGSGNLAQPARQVVDQALSSPRLQAVAPPAPVPAAPEPGAAAESAPPAAPPAAAPPADAPQAAAPPADAPAADAPPAAEPEQPAPEAAPAAEGAARAATGAQPAVSPPAPAEPPPAPVEVAAPAPSGPTVAGVLGDPNLVLPDAARGDLQAGVVDSRLVAVLHSLSEQGYRVELSVVKTGHDQFVHGTNRVSNHFAGRAIDISAVNGQPVNPGNEAGQRLAEALARLPDSIRPTEIGSPWPLSAAGFFSDSAHQDHIHVGFDTPGHPAKFEPEQPEAPPPAEAAAPAAADAVPAAPLRDTAALPRAADPSAGPARATAPLPAAQEPQPAAPPAEHAPVDMLPDGSDTYPGDDAPKEQIAAWMGRQAHKAGLPGELPVMAALVESGLRNSRYGDRDSLGFFQMRTSIWDQGEYAGYPDKPELQLKWFIDHALAVKRQRLERGDSAFLHDSGMWGNWIADVERPAEEYRDRYQLQLHEARNLLGAARDSVGAPPEAAEADVSPDVGRAGAEAVEALAIARKYLGTPYRWGGESPDTGFDCSGIAQYAYARVGIDLPRVAEDQFRVGEHIARDDLHTGDLVFFEDSTGYIHHEGIYVGGGKFLHAPHSGDVVKISSLDEPYYARQFAGGRRHVPLVEQPEAPAPQPPVTPAAVDGPADVKSGSARETLSFAPSDAAPAPGRSTLQVLPVIRAGGGQTADLVEGAARDYPGDAASQEELAQWMAGEARQAGLPAELPVMAALVESGLQNVKYGDRDSFGFFQMRASIWNKDEYAGFADRPELQLKWFIKEAVILREKRVAQGDAAFGQDPSTWGQWIAYVERPEAGLSDRYQERLEEARRLVEGLGRAS